jgi:hypothetical protein
MNFDTNETKLTNLILINSNKQKHIATSQFHLFNFEKLTINYLCLIEIFYSNSRIQCKNLFLQFISLRRLFFYFILALFSKIY